MIALAWYLLKVIICSGILFLYYHIALRNKLFHQWNRFYLLISIFISLAAPVIQLGVLHLTSGQPNKAIQLLQVLESADGYVEEVTIHSQQGFSTNQWLITGYMLVSLVLLLLLLTSIHKIISIIRSHATQWMGSVRFINTRVQGTPFSFFNFIFWNRDIDLQTETGQQIFQHEMVHVREKHTVDKLLVQLVLIVFWCNPFFWLIRKELKLLHEFIADKKAVGEHGTAALAAMILNSTFPTQFNITNQFFQTSIKRRLAMLTKIQNPGINYLSRLLALPILAATVLAFTLKTKQVAQVPLDKTITVMIDAGHGLMPDGRPNGISAGDVNEDGIVLAIANKIKELNRNDKVKIVLTRTSDKLIDLRDRTEIAKAGRADLFISLHLGAAAKDDAMASGKTLNSGFAIYVSNKQPAYQQQSELFGSILRQELNAAYPTNPYLLKRKVGIWVLDQNVCPSVLVECGFLTDANDREYISKGANQKAVAQKILQAIERYAANEPAKKNAVVDTLPKKQPPASKTGANEKAPAQKNEKGMNFDIQNQPLYLVNGIEITKKDLDKINPEDIESIDVLKDKTATDKYGKKGVFGVVEIKLRDGKSIKDYPRADTTSRKEPLFTKVEVAPSIDKNEWTQYLQKSMTPVVMEATRNGMNPGTYIVQVKFIVAKDGSVSDFTVLNDPGFDIAKKVVELMKDSPKWNPAVQNGRPVTAWHTQPITFVVAEQ